MNEIDVKLTGGETISCPEGTIVGTLTGSPDNNSGLPYLGALVNNNVSSLSYPLPVNCEVEFLTMSDPHGWRIYVRSLCFLLAKTVRELFPAAVFKIEHSFGPGLYCSFRHRGDEQRALSKEELKTVEERMRELVRRNMPIERRKLSFAEGIAKFEESGQSDKLNLLRFRNPPHIVVHWCENFYDLAHGPLAPATGALSRFELLHYTDGFVLHYPQRENPGRMEPFRDQPHLFNIFKEHKEWGRILGVNTVGKLNEITARGDIAGFVDIAEALHEKKIARIAEQIASSSDSVRLILVAGPSSAGKTTFAKRLTTHLTVNGIRPVTIATDDYFVGEKDNPLDENGRPDYEHIDAVDLGLFNNNLLKLIQGESVKVPRFNFAVRQREYDGSTLKMDRDQMIIIEGIHGLNPELTRDIPPECEFRIYVSALTQLSLDSNNRISTTDNRLMRRMVRDSKFRGYSPVETLRMWPSVRRGEKRWIFPFQQNAHATFNSALDYELAVLKPYVDPLLMHVKPTHREYAEARRLSEFLLHFLNAPDNAVPGTSILREYIGNSHFKY